ncbi:MAG: RNase adapter RapZ [Myxococcales bacterium]|nr:RNase adapter RapZ [Myxococcales bacterium]
MTDKHGHQTVVVVTGMSGAGKTTALHTLEDLGFFCVDNLPTVLAPQAVLACESGGMTRVALGMDVRVGTFLASVSSVLADLQDGGTRDVHVLFFDASDEALLRRFSESRRPHPMGSPQIAGDTSAAVAVLDGIRLERARLASLRARATRVYDTTHLSVHELRRAIIAQFGPSNEAGPQMLTRVLSFGFKYGVPTDADMLLDVRFLENPYFIPELKPLPGTDERVSRFVLGLPEAQEFLQKTTQLIDFVLPRYQREGKSYLTLAIGCTGGRHRSVALSEALGAELGKRHAGLAVVHRDVSRGDVTRPPAESIHTELKGAANSLPVPLAKKPKGTP